MCELITCESAAGARLARRSSGWIAAVLCEAGRVADRYEFPEGHHMAKLYPAEGDSAVAELWFGEAPWAQVELTGISLDQVGRDRVSEVGFKVSFFAPPAGAEPAWWGFDLQDVEDGLGNAKEWLLGNERGRLPFDSGDGLTAAAQALDKSAEPSSE